MGRKPIGKTAMTATERQRRRRARLRKEQPLADLRAAWGACDRSERARFLRELSADRAAAKKARRAQLERALAEKIVATWPEADRRRWFEDLPIVSDEPPSRLQVGPRSMRFAHGSSLSRHAIDAALVDVGDRIYALRLGGISAREIAKQFSVTIADVNQAVEARMVKIDAAFRAAAIALDSERLEKLLARFLSQAYAGDLASRHLCLRRLERRSHLLGLDRPLRLDAVVTTQPPSGDQHRLLRKAAR